MAEKRKTTTKKPVAKKNKPTKKHKNLTISLKNAKTLKLLAIILVVLLLVIIAAAQFGGVTFSTIGDSIRTSLAGIGSGEGYPYSINGVEISGAGMTNSDLTVSDSVWLLSPRYIAETLCLPGWAFTTV